MFSDQQYADKLMEVWDRIARRYRGRSCVYAYDLINEPVEPKTGGRTTWRELATRAIDTIRAVDPGKPVVYEPGPWGGPQGFERALPLERDRVIYSFHMYQPHAFTHQGVYGPWTRLRYPGVVKGEHWDRERLRETMAPAIRFTSPGSRLAANRHGQGQIRKTFHINQAGSPSPAPALPDLPKSLGQQVSPILFPAVR